MQLVRKEFKRPNHDNADCEAELRTMSLLKLLKHPNIITIISCYTFQSHHNILMPFISGGTLSKLLENPKPVCFEKNYTLIAAATGLASALQALHNFFAKDLAWKAIGLHHDLKPSNILVEDDSLLLADFGLSTLKDSSRSATTFKQVNQYYSAPECHELETKEPKIIGRSSDIWSLGCIFAELATYMKLGPEGVDDFREARSLVRDHVKVFRFYWSPTEEHPEVGKWLQQMAIDAAPSFRNLIKLVLSMLLIAPEERPDAALVETLLQFEAIEAIGEHVEDLFMQLRQRDHTVRLIIEFERFHSWFEASRTSNASGVRADGQDTTCAWTSSFHPPYVEAHKLLLQMSETLTIALGYSDDVNNSDLKVLRHLNNMLFGSGSSKLQNFANKYLKHQVLEMASENVLSRLALEASEPSEYQELGSLAVVERLPDLLDQRLSQDRENIYFDAQGLKMTLELPNSNAYLSELSNDPVLVEWKVYQEHQADIDISTELLERLDTVARLLQEASKVSGLRVLRCRGVFHDVGYYRCGLVYDFPSDSLADSLQVYTLQELISPPNRRKTLPPLEIRFQLAHTLATSLARFHQLSWLQRSISSFNIVFFHPAKSASWPKRSWEPYFLGYSNSRPNGTSPFTEGMDDDPAQRNYLHPAYRENGRVRFVAEFDHYSLGLVLLEIGLWKSLPAILEGNKKCRGKPETVRLKLLELEVPLLRLTMGTKYENAVRTCLGDETLEAPAHHQDLWVKFEKGVLEPLNQNL